MSSDTDGPGTLRKLKKKGVHGWAIVRQLRASYEVEALRYSMYTDTIYCTVAYSMVLPNTTVKYGTESRKPAVN